MKLDMWIMRTGSGPWIIPIRRIEGNTETGSSASDRHQFTYEITLSCETASMVMALDKLIEERTFTFCFYMRGVDNESLCLKERTAWIKSCKVFYSPDYVMSYLLTILGVEDSQKKENL